MSGLRTRRRGGPRRTPHVGPARGTYGSGVSSVARSSREGAVPIAPRLAIAGIVGAIIIGILVLRLWALTVLGGAEYAERADQNVIRRLPIAAPRGSILDRDGRQIVVNRPTNQVVLDLQSVDEAELDGLIERLGEVLAPNRLEVAKTTREIREKVENAPVGMVEPLVLATDVQRQEVVYYLAEHQSEFPGVDVPDAYTREYVQRSTAAHILGQVGMADPDDLTTKTSLQAGDKLGKSGIEKTYDEYLRGVNGYEAIQVDASGFRTEEQGLRGLPAQPGRDLRLTISLPLQKATERSLAQGIAHAAGTEDGRGAFAGAAVAMDPNNGEVLALASAPTYDPNVFTSTKPKDLRTVETLYNPRNKRLPMYNRAIAGAYPPGSIYKPITAIAAMDKGWITPDTLLGCEPQMEIAHTVFKNHTPKNFGAIDLKTALEMSCDTYFYKLAIQFNADPKSPLQDWSSRFGLGKPTGIDIPGEVEGRVPTPKWKKEYDNPYWSETDHIWKPGDSVNLSIGQGDLLTTPLQMTNVYSALANGGKLFTPRLAKQIQSAGGRKEVEIPSPEPTDLNLDPGDLAAITDGLVLVNTGGNGTATAVFGTFKVSTAGKSGTAEKSLQKDLAWYCGYAPVEKPEIAACAFIDGGGHGGSEAGPIVLRMFQQYFGAKGGNTDAAGSVD
ncbi:MAG: Penicillin-binding protein 2 [Thermoleophilia bacterium]|nr:Penicillin-binding protein 2 [Thermoleophilia bacterium]